MDRVTLVSVIASASIGILIGTGALLWVTEKKSRRDEPRESVPTAQVDPVDLCDELASHPDDPEAVTQGVEDEAIDADVAITACEEAVQADAKSPRLRFQLARGYLQAGNVEEAAEQLSVAAEHGHGGALAYLAEMYLDGVQGIEADPVLAKTLYQRAADAGFEPAAAILGEFEDVTEQEEQEKEEATAAQVAQTSPPPVQNTRPKPNYNNPQIVENIQRGNLDEVPYGEIYTKMYLVNMAQNIAQACPGAHFNRRELDELARQAAFTSVELTPEAGLNMLFGGLLEMANFTRNPTAAMERSVRAEQSSNAMPEEAMQDAFALATYEECGSPAIAQFATHLRSYISDEGAPRLSNNEMFARCVREARPTGRYDAQNFCGCFSGMMTRGAISRAQRKGLASDFWKTAQEIMARDPAHYNACVNGWN